MQKIQENAQLREEIRTLKSQMMLHNQERELKGMVCLKNGGTCPHYNPGL